MASFVISVAQNKGGVGKSTLAAQLAVACAGLGYAPTLVDMDRQASVIAWADQRDRILENAADNITAEPSSGWRLPLTLERLGPDYDVVLVDGASGCEGDFAAMVKHADLVLIPCQPTALDLWATRALLSKHQDLRSEALVVLNRMPPRGKAALLIRHEIEKLGWPMARQPIGNRQAYVAAMGAGLGVTEAAPSSLAAQEINALAAEIIERMAGVRLVA